jgi:hypothetical protein
VSLDEGEGEEGEGEPETGLFSDLLADPLQLGSLDKVLKSLNAVSQLTVGLAKRALTAL